MMFFNYENIYLLALGNPLVMLKLFKDLADNKKGTEVLKGDNFIVNPGVILKNPYSLHYQQLAEYLGILSLRNYQHYKQSGDTDIDMAYIPEYIEPKVVKNNPLIEISKSKLIFKEEKICH